MSADTKNMTAEQTRAYLKKFSLWQKLMEEIDRLRDNKMAFKDFGEGLYGVPIQGLAALPQGGWLAAAFGHGVYHMAASERKWKRTEDSGQDKMVLCLGAAPWGDCYAGTYGAGLLVRVGGSRRWQSAFGGPITVQDVAFGLRGEALVGTRENGVIFSTDGGRTWNETLLSSDIRAVALGADGLFWAADGGGGIYLSRDRGLTWVRAALVGRG